MDDGVERAAILLLCLGEESAAEVLKHLGPREVQKLGQSMAELQNVSRDKMHEVIEQFQSHAGEKTSLGLASDEYLRNVLKRALGDDRASGIIERILHGGDTSGIEGLKWMDSSSVAELIKNEHPQIIATILVHLDRDQASEVLSHFTERLRNDAILRIATLDGIQPSALRELNDVMTRLLSGNENIRQAPRGGVRTAAEILNFIGGALENSVIEAVRAYDADLSQRILDEMFVFENLLDLDDRGLQLLLREVQSESLVIALKGATPELREKVFKNMSQRAAEMLKDDIENKGPVRVSEVETEQKEILKIVRRLSEEGQIALSAKGEDAYV